MPDKNAVASPGQGQPEPVERQVDEREALVNKRKARQSGRSPRSKHTKTIMAASLLAGGALVLGVAVGPAGIAGLLGSQADAQKTSKVSLEVGREVDRPLSLDFTVPAEPEPIAAPPSNAPLADKLKSLEDRLAQLSGKEAGVSATELQALLASHSEAINRKLDEERKTLAQENERLRLEAERLAEEKRLAEEAAKLQAAANSEQQKLEQKQRESQAVIVDESNDAIGERLVEGLSDDLDVNERFLKFAGGSDFETSVSKPLTDPSSTVVQGTIISAVLETAIDTELPGTVRAQVMRPVFSFDGSRELMPAGTLLIGQFNNEVAIEQKRVLIAWNRAITPAGQSIALGSIGTDTLGRAGTLGNVDNRYSKKFGAAILVSAITAGPAIIADRVSGGNKDNSGTTINVGGGGGSGGGQGDAIAGLGEGVGEQVSGVLEQYLSLPPLIRVPQGEEIRVFVNRDLIFK